MLEAKSLTVHYSQSVLPCLNTFIFVMCDNVIISLFKSHLSVFRLYVFTCQ